MKSEKMVLGVYIIDILKRKTKEKVVGGDCLVKLSKGGDFKKVFRVWKPWVRRTWIY